MRRILRGGLPVAMSSALQSRKSHWLVLGLCAAAFLVTLLFELFARFGLPEGFYIMVAEVGSSLIAAYYLVTRIRKTHSITEKRIAGYLLAFFLLIGFADGSYTIHYYFNAGTNKTLYSVLVTTLPYSLSYLCAFLAIWHCFSINSRYFFIRKAILIPLGLSIPFVINILFPTLLMGIEKFGFNPFIWGRIGNFICSFLLLNLGILAVLISRSLFWAFFSAGAVQLIVVNWSLTAQRFFGIPYAFGFYEYIWAFGKLLTLTSVIVWHNKDFQHQKFEKNSLIGQTRIAIFAVVTSLLILIQLLTQLDVHSIEFISLIFMIGSLSSILLSQFLSEKITFFASKLGDLVNTGHAQDMPKESLEGYAVELRECYEQIFAKQIEVQKRNKELELKLGSLTRQVAHDIRSPLAALNILTRDLSGMDENQQKLILASTQRIQEIANDLLSFDSGRDSKEAIEQLPPVPISPLIDSLVTEKRIQYAGKNTEIRQITDLDAQKLKCKVDSVVFKRVLSNLINNSVEAIKDVGKISIAYASKEDWVEISLEDNGSGIAREDLPFLFQKGISIGKKQGSGLGLYHAKEHIESWGGSLEIESQLHHGTKVVVRLPQAAI